MRTRITGAYFRLRLKRHLVLWLWDVILDVVKVRAFTWQAGKACLACRAVIEQQAVYCPSCGVAQYKDRQTEELLRINTAVETQRLYSMRGVPVRIGNLRPCLAWWADTKRQGLRPRYADYRTNEEWHGSY